MEVIGSPSIEFLAGPNLNNPAAHNLTFVTKYVDVSKDQYIDVIGEGYYVITYDLMSTKCILWNDTETLLDELNSLASLASSIPVEMEQQIAPNGFIYKLLFTKMAPTILSVSTSSTCLSNVTSANVRFPSELKWMMVFRYLVEDLLYTNVSSVQLATPAAITFSGDNKIKLASSSGIEFSSPINLDSSLNSGIASIEFDSRVPTVTAVSANYTAVGVTGDAIPIKVMFTKPMTVFGSPMLEVEVDSCLENAQVTSNCIRNASFSSVLGNELTFIYDVSLGDVATPLKISGAAALKLFGAQIRTSSYFPITDANLTLPLVNNYQNFTTLHDSNVTLQADQVPQLVSITPNRPTGIYGAGEEIMLTILFSDFVSLQPSQSSNTSHSIGGDNIGSFAEFDSPSYFVTNADGTIDEFKARLYFTGEYSARVTELTFRYLVDERDGEGRPVGINFGNATHFSFTLLDGVLNDDMNHNWTYISTPPDTLLLDTLTIDTSTPSALYVDCTNPDGLYFPGQSLFLTVKFDKPVIVTGKN